MRRDRDGRRGDPLPPPPPSAHSREYFAARNERAPPPSREGPRDLGSRIQASSLPKALRGDQSGIAAVPSPRERGMIDKPPGTVQRRTGSITMSFAGDQGKHPRDYEPGAEQYSPVRRASSISNHNEPSPGAGGRITHPSPGYDMSPKSISSNGPASLAQLLQQISQAHSGDADGVEPLVFAE
ncbi:hypothetical protein BDZ91DRAFT_105166 [Kalaharituber pfeilii]|nr:hypothetical protein BDZ91DRAFT_105166 [Kalaharituber pfeilii]